METNPLKRITSLFNMLSDYIYQINGILSELSQELSSLTYDPEQNIIEEMDKIQKIKNKINENNNNINNIFLDSYSKESSNFARQKVIFLTTQNDIIKTEFDFGTTIDEMLSIYSQNINTSNSRYSILDPMKIEFLYNGKPLKFGDLRKVEDVFWKNKSPTILVNNLTNLDSIE